MNVIWAAIIAGVSSGLFHLTPFQSGVWFGIIWAAYELADIRRGVEKRK